MEDVVCPPKLHQGLFTTGAVDNIDHNPSSATAKDSFHGTGASLIQHPSHTDGGTDRGVQLIGPGTSSKSVTPLPSAYTIVPPAAFKTKEFTVPAIQGPARPSNLPAVAAATEVEYLWVRKVKTALKKSTVDGWKSWSAYHADMHQAVIPPPAINALLPLFLDNAPSVAIIQHSMDIVKDAVQHLNPGQVPALAADQPLYALAKEILWTWPVL